MGEQYRCSILRCVVEELEIWVTAVVEDLGGGTVSHGDEHFVAALGVCCREGTQNSSEGTRPGAERAVGLESIKVVAGHVVFAERVEILHQKGILVCATDLYRQAVAQEVGDILTGTAEPYCLPVDRCDLLGAEEQVVESIIGVGQRERIMCFVEPSHRIGYERFEDLGGVIREPGTVALHELRVGQGIYVVQYRVVLRCQCRMSGHR